MLLFGEIPKEEELGIRNVALVQFLGEILEE
jgi:hypothetical protein